MSVFDFNIKKVIYAMTKLPLLNTIMYFKQRNKIFILHTSPFCVLY